LAHNLDFIADDKLNWRPGGRAGSALEIVNHLLGSLRGIAGRLGGLAGHAAMPAGDAAAAEPAPVTTRAEAQAALAAAAEQYVKVIKSLSAEALGSSVYLETPNFTGDMPVMRLIALGAIECLHHRGQIAYIQLMLGDEDTHFTPLP
jgi:uncharacterized damage-inducible protein DinB